MSPLEAEPSSLLREPLLTAAQVGKLLGGIPSKTVLQYARDGRLPCLHIGKHVRFLRQDVEQAINRQRERARPAPHQAPPVTSAATPREHRPRAQVQQPPLFSSPPRRAPR